MGLSSSRYVGWSRACRWVGGPGQWVSWVRVVSWGVTSVGLRWGGAIVVRWGGAMVVRWGGAMVVRWGGARVVRWGGAMVVRWGGAMVVRWGGPW